MVKLENERVVVTLPKWLLLEFKKTKYFKIVADNNMSNSARIFMLKTIAEEKNVLLEDIKIPKI